jgi:hypothetical protein
VRHAGEVHGSEEDEAGSPDDAEVLVGGVANAGAVIRRGEVVERPANAHSPTIHALLRHLRTAGFDGVPSPIALGPDGCAAGREHLGFVPGEVAVPPYPAWAQSDATLASIAALLRRFHDATVGFEVPPGATWSGELADPEPGPLVERVICHNDVCLENVVHRRGVAVALLDFDFAAPGRREFDLACMARMCVPIDLHEYARRLGWSVDVDPFRRLRVVADAYGLSPGRTAVLDALAGTIERGGQFVLRRVAAGEPAFVKMWESMGGMARFDARREWFRANRQRFADALG